MKFTVLTLFPEMFSSFMEKGILQRGLKKNLIDIDLINFREFSKDKHKKVDDTPYGGGAGMLLACQPIFDAMEDVKKHSKTAAKATRTIYMTPKGKRLTQSRVEKLASYKHVILLCGHYEGVDQRVVDALIDEEVSIGDYVLTGGEIPAMVLIDAVSRYIPGFLGKEASLDEETFSRALKGKKEYPHYTRPPEFRGMKVPEVLTSGNHAEIEKWRKKHVK